MKYKIIIVLISMICVAQIASGQKSDKKDDDLISISGRILNQDKKPIEGAVLYVDNFKTTFRSKSNGSFKIQVSPSAMKIKVTFPGYEPVDTLINNQTLINFNLKVVDPNVAQRSSDSINRKEKDEIAAKAAKGRTKKMNTYTNIYDMIRNEVSGVVVSGRSIVVQQQNSFFGSSQPLFTVNGVIVSSIDNINPMEVKSIALLKGSSATIYGVQGANGVISITLYSGSDKNK